MLFVPSLLLHQPHLAWELQFSPMFLAPAPHQAMDECAERRRSLCSWLPCGVEPVRARLGWDDPDDPWDGSGRGTCALWTCDVISARAERKPCPADDLRFFLRSTSKVRNRCMEADIG